MDGIYLLLGSNLDEREKNLKKAVDQLAFSGFKIKRKSSLYQSAAWGITAQPVFLNQVLEVETTMTPAEILNEILSIEERMGRIREVKWGQRLIDIDILYYYDHVVSTANLTIPHPQIQNRRFTLVPLCELIPDVLHPQMGKTQKALLEATEDSLEVLKL